MQRNDIAYRGFITTEGEVIAWPTLLADHNAFLNTFMVPSRDFAVRWRQWSPGEKPDIDPPESRYTMDEAAAILEAWLP